MIGVPFVTMQQQKNCIMFLARQRVYLL